MQSCIFIISKASSSPWLKSQILLKRTQLGVGSDDVLKRSLPPTELETKNVFDK